MMDTELLGTIREPLMRWYQENARVLPWREHPSPYYVWVSEIMLQQTRVEAVKSYFRRFVSALPDIPSLAACPQDRLMKLWEGLGYYNRARNMQKAAKLLCENYGGELPADYDLLLALPGIGSYTAGAISSIAFDLPVPAVDGNVLRVLARLTASREDIAKPSVKKKTEEALRKVMPQKGSGSFNQSLMELGALICLPHADPKCACCPLNKFCRARQEGIQTMLPLKSPQKKRRVEERTVLLIKDGSHAAIVRRAEQGLLAGLYELPNFAGRLSKEEAISKVSGLGFSAIRITPLPDAKHIFTHIEWHMRAYLILVEDTEDGVHASDKGEVLFLKPEEIRRSYPIPSAFSAYSRKIFETE